MFGLRAADRLGSAAEPSERSDLPGIRGEQSGLSTNPKVAGPRPRHIRVNRRRRLLRLGRVRCDRETPDANSFWLAEPDARTSREIEAQTFAPAL
ncbi:hypothetical protein NDU88_000887 [Pleurodeles waltl]|uniref:Uncharacterized protein n=1 Tax=Pleurodeles waltl TaxID=8319 RepID=A0AAV7SAS6_PLEWA|nr:hypothetical protein NDU88_000887 [Pleurodeles waltl]